MEPDGGLEGEAQSSSSVGDSKAEFALNDEKNKSPDSTKGKGLKKWRRIRRRESGGNGVDLNRILKHKFTQGDSDNSEELSSKFRPPSRNYSQAGKRVESTKKHRGGIHKDGSYSSVESDSNQFSGNGRRSDPQPSDQHSNEYLFRDNGSSEQGTTLDPFSESILALQTLHDALQKEIQNFGEIGMEPIEPTEDSSSGFILNPEFHSVVSEDPQSNSSGHVPIEEMRKKSSLPEEADLIKINHKVYTLESRLEKTMSMLETKESRIIELEGILNEKEFPNTEQESSVQSPQKCKEIEAELEDLFRHKIEAEVEYLTMRKTSQKLKLASEDQIALFEEQKALINEQNKILHSFRDAEKNIPQTEMHKLATSGQSVEPEDMKMQRRLCKYSCCFTIQLMLLFLVFGLSLFPLWPGPTEFAPT